MAKKDKMVRAALVRARGRATPAFGVHPRRAAPAVAEHLTLRGMRAVALPATRGRRAPSRVQEEFKLNKKEQKKYDKLMSSIAWHEARKAPRADETDPHHMEAEKLRIEADDLMRKARDEFSVGAR